MAEPGGSLSFKAMEAGSPPPSIRTGYFGEVLLLPESSDGSDGSDGSDDDQLAERVARARPIVRRRLLRRLVEQLDDGRAYVVEWQPALSPGEWSVEMLQDQVTAAAAFVTLLRPEEARVGDLVHIDSFRIDAIRAGPDGLIPIGDWRFAWTPNGWERVK